MHTTDDDDEEEWAQKFRLPLDLIASRSKYFKSLFQNGFAESQSGVVKLHDISPWVFRTFVGWLYYQNIFYDPEYKTPRRFQKPATSTASKSKDSNSKTETDATKGYSNGNIIERTGEDDSAENSAVTKKELSAGKQKPAQLSTELSRTSIDHPPGGNKRKFSQEHEVVYGEDGSEDECNYREPTTWPAYWLFELYIFSDKYDVPDFRAAVFEVVQMKYYQEDPRNYHLPSPDDTLLAIENLPPTSPLYRLLVDSMAVWLKMSALHGDPGRTEYFENFPAHFLSRCLVKSRRAEDSLRCAKCKPGGTDEKCDSKTHSSHDHLSPPQKDVCHYHEHGDDDEEKARCVLRWESRRHLL